MLLARLIRRVDGSTNRGAHANASLGLPIDDHVARVIRLLEGSKCESAFVRTHVRIHEETDAVAVDALFAIQVLLEVVRLRRDAQRRAQAGHFETWAGWSEDGRVLWNHGWPREDRVKADDGGRNETPSDEHEPEREGEHRQRREQIACGGGGSIRKQED